MIHTDSRRLYADSAYDKHFCLKPPALLWLAVLFLSREISLPLVMGMAQFTGVNGAALTEMRRLWAWDLSVVPSVIAALVLYVLFRRVPSAPHSVRWLWTHAAGLLACSAILDSAATMASVIRVGELNERSVLSAASVAIDIVILCYVFISRRLRDSFADFPD